MTPSIKSMKEGTCGCGRSPTGDCIGWHSLTEDEYQNKLEKWNAAGFECRAETGCTCPDQCRATDTCQKMRNR